MMLGDASVGKTSLTVRYISGTFMEDLKLTIGVDFYSKVFQYMGKNVKFQVWDFGGEKRFRFLLSQYCKGANGAFFLYDTTNKTTLEHLSEWTQIVREHAGKIPIVLIGSKCDLEAYKVVQEEEGRTNAQKYNLSGFIELSSKTGKNVTEAFDQMTVLLFKTYAPEVFK
ncbi:MAG: GTP-binding protein [Candidatus Lokiarchaeota archaeon]|nr:GTP-binding protein [Candidatus Lokiarchaeota archaeon]